MTVTTGGRGLGSPWYSTASSSENASGSSSVAATALWPSSSTTIIAVSWSSDWLMVTIWPNFINTLMTSEALTAILCASSATVMVSGTCTSSTRCSAPDAVGWLPRSSRPPLPGLPLGPARHELPLLRAATASARALAASFFLPASSFHDDDSASDLTSFLAGAAPASPPARAWRRACAASP